MTEFVLGAISRVVICTLSSCSWKPDALGYETLFKIKQNKIIMEIDQLQTEKGSLPVRFEIFIFASKST